MRFDVLKRVLPLSFVLLVAHSVTAVHIAGANSFVSVTVSAAFVPSDAELSSYLPDCVVTENLSQKALDTSPIRRDRVGGADIGTQPELLAIFLRIRDTARVPEDVLTKAQGDVTRIYRQAGVEMVWPTPESLSAESNAVRQAALTVAILTRDQADQLESGVAADGRVGFAARANDGAGRLVYVFYDRVQLLTGGNRLPRSRMLAIAMAHEIGHLLLPDKAHSTTGLMRAYWTHADLRFLQRELIFFTAGQSRLLRSRISSSPYRISGEALQKHLCSEGSR